MSLSASRTFLQLHIQCWWCSSVIYIVPRQSRVHRSHQNIYWRRQRRRLGDCRGGGIERGAIESFFARGKKQKYFQLTVRQTSHGPLPLLESTIIFIVPPRNARGGPSICLLHHLSGGSTEEWESEVRGEKERNDHSLTAPMFYSLVNINSELSNICH